MAAAEEPAHDADEAALWPGAGPRCAVCLAEEAAVGGEVHAFGHHAAEGQVGGGCGAVADATEPAPGFGAGFVHGDAAEGLGADEVGVAGVNAGMWVLGDVRGVLGVGVYRGEGAAIGEVHVESLVAEDFFEDLAADLEG